MYLNKGMILKGIFCFTFRILNMLYSANVCYSSKKSLKSKGFGTNMRNIIFRNVTPHSVSGVWK
jgi:hypothetical protein